VLRWLGAAAVVAGERVGIAQGAEPIKVVIAFPPGGTSTASIRPLQEPLLRLIGAPFELEGVTPLGSGTRSIGTPQ
jgi:hypothetical protein